MNTYILTAGKHRRTDGTRMVPGDEIELTAEQAEAFGDRFVLKTVQEAVAEAIADANAEAKTEAKTEASAVKPVTSAAPAAPTK